MNTSRWVCFKNEIFVQIDCRVCPAAIVGANPAFSWVLVICFSIKLGAIEQDSIRSPGLQHPTSGTNPNSRVRGGSCAMNFCPIEFPLLLGSKIS